MGGILPDKVTSLVYLYVCLLTSCFFNHFYCLIYVSIHFCLLWQGENLTVHIYVKNVSKDAVKIHFDKQSFTVKFQTRSVLALLVAVLSPMPCPLMVKRVCFSSKVLLIPGLKTL